MRAVVLGPPASGKSRFALELGAITGVQVFHVDLVVEDIGRRHPEEIRMRLAEYASRDSWIIDGNSFGKDPVGRINRSQVVFVFRCAPMLSLMRHVMRWVRLRAGAEKRLGARRSDLDLKFFIPYIFVHLSRRQKAVIGYAQSIGKEIVVFKKRRDVTNYKLRLLDSG
ncbi:P-loop NTPase family protein [Saccharothrix hoggarensis]|uniref:Adenylate kinase family enzyme n=1 Tax=Saccharothrix hoggarensis TaxID=913853 RepID=A0ABW3R3X9_9PSEU